MKRRSPPIHAFHFQLIGLTKTQNLVQRNLKKKLAGYWALKFAVNPLSDVIIYIKMAANLKPVIAITTAQL